MNDKDCSGPLVAEFTLSLIEATFRPLNLDKHDLPCSDMSAHKVRKTLSVSSRVVNAPANCSNVISYGGVVFIGLGGSAGH